MTTDTFPTTGPTDVRPSYAERVAMLEAEGLTTSDAQGVADAEVMMGELAEDEPTSVCLTCTNDLGWHRRRADHLERVEGPRAVLEFEQAHPES
jgi:hypothetical protein